MNNNTTTTWAIPNFDKDLKDRFIGTAKMQGMTCGIALHYIVAKWLREEREKEHKDDNKKNNRALQQIPENGI